MPFDSFTTTSVPVRSSAATLSEADLSIFVRQGGTGPPLLLLHGWPQTSFIYHEIADRLAERYTVVLPDLRGYGRSSKPAPQSDSHVEYSKREVANDLVQLMQHFGHETFYLVGHDRGGRVSHRLALDHPHAVRRLMLLDISPTLYAFENIDRATATSQWHWFFQLLPNAEEMMIAAPDAFWKTITKGFPFHPEAEKEYREHFFTKEGLHGACEDYRAAATIDLEHDQADREAGKKLSLEALRIIWGTSGTLRNYKDVLAVWRDYSQPSVQVSGRSVESGHYIPEQAPQELLKEILEFFPVQR